MNFKNMFKFGVKKKTLSPKLVSVKFQGKEQPALLWMPYGMNFNPKENSLVGILADQGNESSLFAMATDIENREVLEDGEVSFGIPGLKSKIYLKKDGTITVENENGSFSLKPNGQFQANGFTVDP
jgi:hypothetical protein